VKISHTVHRKFTKCLVTAALCFVTLISTNIPTAFSQEAESVENIQEVIGRGFTHNTFARVIFKAKHKKDFSIIKKNDVLSLTFGSQVNANIENLNADIKKYVIATETDKDRRTIHLLLAESNFKVRRFYGKNFVGIDIISPPKLTSKKGTRFSGTLLKPTKKPEFFILDVEDELKDLEAQLTKEQEKSIIESIWTRIFPQEKPSFLESFFLSEGAPKEKPINPTLAAEIRLKQLKDLRNREIEIAKSILRDKLDVLRLTRQERIDRARQELKDQEIIKRDGITRSELQDAKRREIARLLAEEAARREKILTLEHDKTENGIKIIFPWTKSVAAAFYARGHHIWAIFNKPIILESDNINDHPHFTAIEKIDNDNYTIVRFTLGDKFDLNHIDEDKEFVHVKAELKDTVWEMTVERHNTLEEGSGMVANSVGITINGSQQGPQVFLAAKNPVAPITIVDSIVGDKLYIAPLYNNETGIAIKRDFVDFSLPATAQGIVIQQKSDGITYGINGDGITISSNNRLNISQDLWSDSTQIASSTSSARVKKAVLPSETIFPFEFKPFLDQLPEEDLYAQAKEDSENIDGKHADEDKPKETSEHKKARLAKKEARTELERLGGLEFIMKKRELYNNLLKAKDNEKTKRRLDIAKYLFSQKMYHEALGVLQEVKVIDPIFEGMQEVDLLVAASRYLLRQYRQAEKDFTVLAAEAKGHGTYDEINLWRWMSYYHYNTIARKRTADELPFQFNDLYEKFMTSYPEKIRFSMGLQVVDFLINKHLVADASALMGIITLGEPPKEMSNDILFMEGKIAAANDEIEDAIDMWEELVLDTEDRHNRARALYELTKIRLINGITSPEEAIDQFNIVGTIWRGDTLELDVLKIIGQLYIKEENYMDGLNAWRSLVANFPHTKEALFIAGKMKQTFIKLFDEGEAYNLKPFKALSLYFEFRELTPVGDIGDRITQQLAEHFINADLLINAANIIAHQIRFRTSGDLKHLLTLKLAKLYLQDKQYAAAIQAINKIKTEDINPSIATALKYEEARAYLALGEHKTTLKTLWNDFSPTAQTIRIGIFWAKRNWFGVMDIIEPRLPAWTEEGRAQLNEVEMEQVMRLAIAYRMQEDFDKIKQLKSMLKDQIENTKLESRFNFVTSKMLKLNFKDFAKTVQLDEIEEFMLEYSFWPSKDWKNVADVLAPRVQEYVNNNDMNDEDRAKVVRLALAYAMQMDDLDSDLGRISKRKLSDLQRDFRDININSTTIRELSILDRKFEPKIDDEIFSGKIPLKDLPEFIPIYTAAEYFSELNKQL
jgi:hypothetical protein